MTSTITIIGGMTGTVINITRGQHQSHRQSHRQSLHQSLHQSGRQSHRQSHRRSLHQSGHQSQGQTTAAIIGVILPTTKISRQTITTLGGMIGAITNMIQRQHQHTTTIIGGMTTTTMIGQQMMVPENTGDTTIMALTIAPITFKARVAIQLYFKAVVPSTQRSS